jgi:hypothetical protein
MGNTIPVAVFPAVVLDSELDVTQREVFRNLNTKYEIGATLTREVLGIRLSVRPPKTNVLVD